MFGEFLVILALVSSAVVYDISSDGKAETLPKQQSAQEKTKEAQQKKENVEKTIDVNTP